MSPSHTSSSLRRRLEGKVALITGAASGIGKATATKFVENGAKVLIADIQQELGQNIAKALGSSASFVSCDVTKEPDIASAVDSAVSKYGRLDIMYCNAGVFFRPYTILGVTHYFELYAVLHNSQLARS